MKILKIFLIVILVVSIACNIYFIINTRRDNKPQQLLEVSGKDESGSRKEIERKWIFKIENLPFDLDKAGVGVELKQTYISFSPEIRIREINGGTQYMLTIKSDLTFDGLTRSENEYYLTKEEYEYLYNIRNKEAITIEKKRYQVMENEICYNIDVFHNEEFKNLYFLEVEFENQEEANNYQPPNWVEREVTDNVNYKNGVLARNGLPKDFEI